MRTSVRVMRGRMDTEDGIGCLLGAAGAATGLVAWLVGAEPRLRGGFEGEGRDLSLLWIELPLTVFGLPVAVLAVHRLLHTVLRGRVAPGTGTWASVLGALAVLALLGWGCLAWLDGTSEVPPPQERV